MGESKRILAVNASYRDDGITDQAVDAVVDALKHLHAKVEVVQLRAVPIEFCLNCRACTQEPGTAPGTCVHRDAMGVLVQKIESADGFVLASPTNLGTATALFKRFMERLVVYAYWPWGADYPKFRKSGTPQKRAILVSSCAAPGVLGRWLYGTRRQLAMTAQVIGADVVGTPVHWQGCDAA